MNNNSIISILINNDKVNLYTKILIFLFYRKKDENFEISDKTIFKYLKIQKNNNNKTNISRVLKELENDKIIKIILINHRRYFKWLLKENPTISQQKIKIMQFLEGYNWLE